MSNQIFPRDTSFMAKDGLKPSIPVQMWFENIYQTFKHAEYQKENNVKWFGAKGDGVHDDTLNIQAADVYATANQGDLFFPEGQYLVSSNFSFSSGTRVIMHSKAYFTSLVAVTVTFNSEFIAGLSKIFDTNITAVFGDNSAPVAYPQWWGAVALTAADDAGTDQGPLLQRFFDCGLLRGHIPGGYYMVTADTIYSGKPRVGVNIPSNFTLTMDRDTVLKAISGNTSAYSLLTVFDESNISITGGVLEGDILSLTNVNGQSGSQAGFGLRCQGGTNITVRDVTATNCFGDGFYIGYSDEVGSNLAESVNVSLIDCTAHTNFRNGASIVGCEGGAIRGGSYHDNGGVDGVEDGAPKCGIDIEPNPNGSPTAWTVSDFMVNGANIYDNGEVGIEVYSPPGSPNAIANIITITNCIIQGNSISGMFLRDSDGLVISNNQLIYGTNGQESGILIEHCTNVSVSNNNVKDHSGGGIVVQNRSVVTTEHISINGNTVNNCNSGISLNGTSGKIIKYVNISNNIINECTAHAMQALFSYQINIIGNTAKLNGSSGGVVLSTTDNCNIGSNIIEYNGGNGIKIVSSTNTNVCNNSVSFCSISGIMAENSNYLSIIGNTSFLNLKDGILFDGVIDSNISFNNVFGNSQNSNGINDNIRIDNVCTNIIIIGNQIRRDGGTILFPKYGIHLRSANVTNTLVKDNELTDSGLTDSFMDSGTSNNIQNYSGKFTGINMRTIGNAIDFPIGLFDVNGEINVGKNVASDLASSGYINLRLGILASTPSNATDCFVGPHDTGGPGSIAGDLILIPRTTTATPGSIRMFTGATTPLERVSINTSGILTSNYGVTLAANADLIGSSTSDITINTDKFTVAGATGNTHIAGTLSILSATTGATLIHDATDLTIKNQYSTNGALILETASGSIIHKPSGVTTLTMTSTESTFAFPVITVLSGTGAAGFNLPHGAAPTSPVDGDMWTTTGGLFVRINGVTKTVTLT